MPIVAATPEAIARAAALLREGGLVAFPTETVYGVGGDATSDRAVAAIFAAKARPHFNPLIAHVPDLDAAASIAAFDERARELARRFWPGPLTMVLPRRRAPGGAASASAPVSLLASAGLDTVAVRVPAHPVAQCLLRQAGRPIAAPSANRSGRVSPTAAAHVANEFGEEIALILDGGPCAIGLESTVLDLSGPQAVLLRPGGITLEALAGAIGRVVPAAEGDETPRSPGRLLSHYAPTRPVRLNAREPRPGEALLAFGPDAPAGFAEMLYLSRSGDTTEAAANLFAMLRRLDRPEIAAIAVMPIPEEGLGLAINDRLHRAAAPRPA